MLVVDLLHEFELGVWKAVFMHLLRIVDSLKGDILSELDRWSMSILLLLLAKLNLHSLQLSSSTDVWPRYYPAFSAEHHRVETDGCS